jgi:hypothetical protein
MLQAEQLAFRAWTLIVAGVGTMVTGWLIAGLSEVQRGI